MTSTIPPPLISLLNEWIHFTLCSGCEMPGLVGSQHFTGKTSLDVVPITSVTLFTTAVELVVDETFKRFKLRFFAGSLNEFSSDICVGGIRRLYFSLWCLQNEIKLMSWCNVTQNSYFWDSRKTAPVKQPFQQEGKMIPWQCLFCFVSQACDLVCCCRLKTLHWCLLSACSFVGVVRKDFLVCATGQCATRLIVTQRHIRLVWKSVSLGKPWKWRRETCTQRFQGGSVKPKSSIVCCIFGRKKGMGFSYLLIKEFYWHRKQCFRLWTELGGVFTFVWTGPNDWSQIVLNTHPAQVAQPASNYDKTCVSCNTCKVRLQIVALSCHNTDKITEWSPGWESISTRQDKFKERTVRGHITFFLHSVVVFFQWFWIASIHEVGWAEFLNCGGIKRHPSTLYSSQRKTAEAGSRDVRSCEVTWHQNPSAFCSLTPV